MTIVQSAKNLLRNAFSYAVYQESAADRDRKLGVAQTIAAASAPAASASGAEYDANLLATLLQARTKFLDVIAEKKIAVTLDSRLSTQKIEDKEVPVAGVFYQAPQENAAGGIVALFDDGKSKETSRTNGILLEKLARLVTEVTPAAPVYAYAWSDMALEPMGGGAVINISEWGIENNDQSTAARNNPALKAPAAKAAPAAPKN